MPQRKTIEELFDGYDGNYTPEEIDWGEPVGGEFSTSQAYRKEVNMSIKNKAEKLYKSVNTFILSCVGRDGYPHVKAVVPDKHRESLSEIYFCTNTSSRFASEIAANPKAGVYFYSRSLLWSGCMLKGEMEIVSDMAVKEKYWDDKFKNAYPLKSPADPDFCVLKFTPISGRYYSMYKTEDFDGF